MEFELTNKKKESKIRTIPKMMMVLLALVGVASAALVATYFSVSSPMVVSAPFELSETFTNVQINAGDNVSIPVTTIRNRATSDIPVSVMSTIIDTKGTSDESDDVDVTEDGFGVISYKVGIQNPVEGNPATVLVTGGVTSTLTMTLNVNPALKPSGDGHGYVITVVGSPPIVP